ncbi:hypothetical protein DL96DRAFT_1591738 [Flagelloscypha sp. PMI_526]|nr:hypothetical protein DL96DRAFT_1591738 [Flagelloscypha sp. PMI_526]
MALPWELAAKRNTIAIREGLRIIRGIVGNDPLKQPNGWTTKELYQQALAVPVSAKFEKEFNAVALPETSSTPRYLKSGALRRSAPSVPNKNHAIQSLGFLKNSILPILSSTFELRLKPVTRTFQRVVDKPAQGAPVKGLALKGVPFRQQILQKTATQTSTEPPPPTKQSPAPWKINPRDTLPKYGNAIGLDVDYSHLSRRRQRTRAAKQLVEAKKAYAIKQVRKALRPSMKDVKAQKTRRGSKELKRIATSQQDTQAKESPLKVAEDIEQPTSSR